MDRMQKLGELLREFREKKKMSTSAASSATKIRESMIIAMENGDYKLFNSDIHLKGFIKAYAKFLGINDEKAIAMYRRERKIIEETPEEIEMKASKRFNIGGRIAKIFNWKAFTAILSLLLISIIIYFFYIQIQAFYVPPRLEIISPKSNTTLNSDTFTIEGFTDNISVRVSVDGNQATFVESSGKFRVNAKFNQPGPKRFTITAENEFKKKTELSLDLVYTPQETLISRQKVRFFNKSASETQFSYTIDNKSANEVQILKPQESSEIDFDLKLGIKNFDPTKLDVYLNTSSSPLNSINAKEFTITIENSVPIIKTN